MKITIIGAGMGGLSAGIALQRLGHDVQVYERVTEIKPVGAAISLWSNGVKCLNYLGLEQQIAALGGRMDFMAYVDGASGETMTRFSLAPLVQQVGQRPYPVARGALQNMLLEEFGPQDVHLGMALAGVEDDGAQVTAVFADGSRVSGDLLIGADGTHSTVRAHVLGSQPERRYAGYVNWNGLVEIDADIAPADQWTTFVGEGKRVSVMPIADHRFYFFFDVPLPKGLPNEKEQYQALLKTYFKGWAQPVQRLIERIDPQATNRVEIHDIEPFMQWTRGRVALLGDAAHSTTPDIGQGGCQAMEDAVVLAMALQTNTLGVEDALVRYQNRRNQRTAELVLRARKRCDITHAKDPAVTQTWYDGLWKEGGDKIIHGIVANIDGNPLG
ncbi:FAD-dependent urate hydroxylase HpxO [Corticibacter populi]|uniref:FAD-dependent urate hydroxylase n=1 Tax=Corticibacter populi TaxID=1550736 RepID=A0A3M6R1X8_9BURK|nr:FAD-dependent urate hydroxylase HpxO [Corticibacter populi]RMX08919.1 FAD-dependent urate hydroxylase HpxO [Corticibacter populi]RZS35928.1 FAD-dependent urate hydroxylase [Corticibacter populi]